MCAAFFGGCASLLMLYPEIAAEAAREACGLWANKVMPALFPYLVASQLLAACFSSGLLLIPLSMLGGSPAGARLISLSRVNGQKAQRLSALCATVSPLYIVGTLEGGYRMLLCHWLGALFAWAAVCAWQRLKQAKGVRASRHCHAATLSPVGALCRDECPPRFIGDRPHSVPVPLEARQRDNDPGFHITAHNLHSVWKPTSGVFVSVTGGKRLRSPLESLLLPTDKQGKEKEENVMFSSPPEGRKKGFLRDLSLKRGFQKGSAPLAGVQGAEPSGIFLQPPPDIPQAIADSVLAMLSVCGCMVLFSVLSALAARVAPLSLYASAALLSVLEMAGGCNRILSLGLPANKAAPIVCAALSFGGLSVFLQNASFLKRKDINLRIQLFAKLIHAFGAYGIYRIIS